MELKLEKTNVKELEGLVQGEKKVSEAKIEKSLNYDSLSASAPSIVGVTLMPGVPKRSSSKWESDVQIRFTPR